MTSEGCKRIEFEYNMAVRVPRIECLSLLVLTLHDDEPHIAAAGDRTLFGVDRARKGLTAFRSIMVSDKHVLLSDFCQSRLRHCAHAGEVVVGPICFSNHPEHP